MAIDVLYEEEVSQPVLCKHHAGELPEVDVATLAGMAAPAAIIPAAPNVLETWREQRRTRALSVRQAEIAYQSHTGTADWDVYVASYSCRHMLKTLAAHGLDNAQNCLAKHWHLIFGGKLLRTVCYEFLAKLQIEVFFPYLSQPTPEYPLEGIAIQWVNGKPVYKTRRIAGLNAADARFPKGKPLVILSWGDISPWSVIVPGKCHVQTGTFHYTDEKGRFWETGTVFSDVFLANLRRNGMRAYLADAELACARVLERGTAKNLLARHQAILNKLDRKIEAWSKIVLPEKQVRELTQRANLFEIGDRAAPRGLLLTGSPGTGKTLVASILAKSMGCDYQQLSLADLKQQQVGASGQKVREVWNRARKNQPAVIFLDECEGVLGRRGAAETDAFSNDIVQAFLAEWDGVQPSDRVWVIGATNRRDMLDDAILSRFGWEMELALPGPEERLRILEHEMEQVFPGAKVPEDMVSLTQGLSGRDLRTLASTVRTLAYPDAPRAQHFHDAVRANRKAANTRVDADATWDTLIVDAPVMDKLKLTCALLRNAEAWKAQGIEVPRSLLLTGPAGTGKTQIARTLANESGLSFLAATTADVKANFLGQSGNRVKQLFERARTKAPVILFLDELDIVAPIRGASHDPLTEEIVGQLLQEMSGITAHDSQVFLLAATNLQMQIDPAVLSRFQQTIAIPLPSLDARRRLLGVLLRKKRLSFELEPGAEMLALMTEGRQLSGRDVQSWVARAEQQALMRAIEAGGPEHFSLLLEDFD